MGKKTDLVSIIIVNRNGLPWLTNCFGSLMKQKYKDFEIIFVDNASTDQSVSWVKKYYPETKIVRNNNNLGFADANNIGYRIAKGKYIVFLNNDTSVTPDFISEFVKILEGNPSIGGAQSKILLMDDPTRLDSIGAFLTPTGFLYHFAFRKKDNKKFDTEIDLYTAKGASMIFRRDVLESIKVEDYIFDPDFFAYFEETDLCHRIWIAGYRVVYAYKCVIHHKVGGTSSRMDSVFIQYHSFKNRIRTYIKNCGIATLMSILPLHLLLCEMYSALLITQGKISLGLAIQRAIWWNILHLRHSLTLRKYIQKKVRKVNDDTIMSLIFRKPSMAYYHGLLSGEVNEQYK